MSYEGYDQFLCKKGHYWTNDVEVNWDGGNEKEKCPICGEEAVWENQVNITNGSYDDDGNRIDGFVDLKIEKCTQGICSKCKKPHVCGTIYKIPKDNAVVGEGVA